MPNITKRTNKNGDISYRIRVYVDEVGTGKQLVKSKTWKPPVNMRVTAAEKEAFKQAALFEEQVKHGLVAFDGATRFGGYIKNWIENEPLAYKTRERYSELYSRIDTALGRIKLEKLQAHHLEEFYKNLAESGVNRLGSYAIASGLKLYLKKQKITENQLTEKTGLSITTIQAAKRGHRVSIKTAEKISKSLNQPIEKFFTLHKSNSGLSDQTIRHHHRLISAVLESAKRQRLVPFNVAREHMKAPKVEYKEAKYLSDEQASVFLSLALNEPDIRYKTALVMLLFSGARRGELCGLSWGDVDIQKEIINIKRAAQYQNRVGVVEIPTKNKFSVRAIKMPTFVFDILTEYRLWWNKQKLMYGKDWQGEKERLFIQDNGKPIYPGTINIWLTKFLKKHDMSLISPHSLRHTFATLQITAGVDVRTLQARTGHSQASTLINTYSHAIKSAQEAASDALENILLPKAK